MRRARIYLSLLFLLCLPLWAGGQSVQSLQQDIQKYKREIEEATKLLDQTRKSQKTNQTELNLVRSRIRSRRNIISSLEKQMTLIGKDIEDKNRTIGGLNKDVARLKKEYGEMIYAAYKNYKLNNFLLFLFASQDFNEATRRVNYMRRYNDMRVQKAGQIRSLADSIGVEVAGLDQKRRELEQTKDSHAKEVTSLAKDEDLYAKSVTRLKQEETKLAKEVRAKQAQIDKAQKRINEIIAEEARKSKAGRRTPEDERYIAELTGRFDQNRGKLPMPIRNGIITLHFGRQRTATGLTIEPKGVYVSSSGGAEVRCVFEGTVSRVFALPGLNNSVMVRHGNYITVYSNLETVSVKVGDNLSAGQKVGNIFASDNADENFLYFQIWQESSPPVALDPELWLR